MKAQIVLTPTESKKLIARAVVRMPEVARALDRGTVVLHPSSSTYFIVEEITGKKPSQFQKVWVCGVIALRGLCAEANSWAKVLEEGYLQGPGGFRFSWIFRRGELQPFRPLDGIIEELGEGDVYLKGVNALDPQGNAGVLLGSMAEGTIGRVAGAARRRGFQIIFPVGLEKLIPVPISEASRETGSNRDMDYAMGMASALVCVPGKTVTEVDAIRILSARENARSGARAVPVAAGGLGGAEGSVVLIVKGEREEVEKAIIAAEAVKGARLPQLELLDCAVCSHKNCTYPKNRKPWVD